MTPMIRVSVDYSPAVIHLTIWTKALDSSPDLTTVQLDKDSHICNLLCKFLLAGTIRPTTDTIQYPWVRCIYMQERCI